MGFVIFIVSLFVSNSIFSQQVNNGSAVDKLRAYSGKAYQEKLFLHTDREFYISGEVLWFKIYYVDGAFHKPGALSRIAYVEIINEKNDPVLQATVSLLPGESNGSFYLPTSLSTGSYTIRSYTNWMKNFDAAYFFEKRITIVNTINTSEALVVTDTINTPVVNFFPEGGNLVNDIQSKVGFTVTDTRGGINNCRGYILDKNGDTVESFSPMKFGIGHFNFKPLKGNTYKAIVVFPGGIQLTKAMPEAFDNGYVMQLSENDRGQIIINIQRKNNSEAGNTTEQLLLAVHTRQVLRVAEKIQVTNNNYNGELIIDKNRIGTGVVHFTLFNGNDQPVCERLFFVKPSSGISVTVKSDQNIYNSRKKISLTVSAQKDTEANSSINLSASVFKIDELQLTGDATIAEYMWLTSDLPNNVESPGYYFSNDANATKAADNLMLTHGWRRFKWDDILKGNDSFVKYLPEINGQLVKGRVTDIRNDQPAANVHTYLSITGNPFGFYVAASDSHGSVYFEVKNFYGNRQVISRPGIETDSLYKVEILNPFADGASGRKYTSYRLNEGLKAFLIQRSIDMQVQNIYSGDSIRNFKEPLIIDSLPFYGLPETEYKLDDYKRFTTMEEVLREYVTQINVGVRNGNLILKLFSTYARDFYRGRLFVLLDGVALSDPDKILTYNPLKVKKLDVISNQYIIGPCTFNGVVSFTTYEGNFDGFELDPKLVAIDYNGLQLHREFYSPIYETKEQLEKRIPDFRNTLLWSPDINTDAEGKASLQFYSSDRAGKYIAVLQGINKNGDPVSAFTTFLVE
ncbi:MAG TPA: hypothetical protein VF144_13200 [Chitinophagaceae bacterium]